jgi:hypothetical protein
MQVTKVRASSDANGLVPAGRYFEQLSKTLRTANAREQTRSAKGNAQDRELEGLYRHASAARSGSPRIELAG